MQFNHIYLTGDTHGNFQRIADFCYQTNTTKHDLLIILGDAGFNYYLNQHDTENKQFANNLPITLLCIHGNHEERPYLVKSNDSNEPTYKEFQFADAMAYYEPKFKNIIFAKDGEIYNLNNHKCLAIGGAYSVDKYYRIRSGYHWFSSEQPDDKIKNHVMQTLDVNNWKIDVVLSHTTPLKYEPTEWFISGLDQSTVDQSTEQWLDTIENKLNYKKWYAGHFHGEKIIDKLKIMFEDYADLEIDLKYH